MEVYFAFGLSIAAFFYGFSVAALEIFPFKVLSSAALAWTELVAAGDLVGENPNEIATTHPAGGVVTYEVGRAYDGLTFVTLYAGESFEMQLIGMQGETLHRWHVTPSDVLGLDHESIVWVPADEHQAIHGAYLYENGDVVFNFEYAGFVKLDRCSNVIWTLDEPTHHAVTVEPDGSIWVPSRRLIRKPTAANPRLRMPYWEDLLLKLSPEGNVERRISVLGALTKSKYQGLFAGDAKFPEARREDPLHLNDVDIVDESLARRHPAFSPGDIMLSMRAVSALAVLDRVTGEVKWTMRGPFLRQHDPDTLPDGTLLFFDNRSRNLAKSGGNSRIVRIDPLSMQPLWTYEGSQAHPFFTNIQGKLQPLPNGNILVVEAEGGRIFEIEQPSGEIVWEFINLLTSDERIVGRVTQAERIAHADAQFVGKPCP